MSENESVSLVTALRSYFGIAGNEMVAEFKNLTDKDKDDFVLMFKEIGIDVHRVKTQ